MTKKRGLDYRPSVKYILDKIPANERIADMIDEDSYIGPEEVKDYVKDNITKLDYLITKCHDMLEDAGDEISFEEYKSLAVKKYYCHKTTTTKENKKIDSFERCAASIEGDVASDLYPRLLELKRDSEKDLEHLDELKEIENSNFNRVLADMASATN